MLFYARRNPGYFYIQRREVSKWLTENGITVEIGGDTTGLSKALSGINKDIKNTQSQLKAVESEYTGVWKLSFRFDGNYLKTA